MCMHVCVREGRLVRSQGLSNASSASLLSQASYLSRTSPEGSGCSSLNFLENEFSCCDITSVRFLNTHAHTSLPSLICFSVVFCDISFIPFEKQCLLSNMNGWVSEML